MIQQDVKINGANSRILDATIVSNFSDFNSQNLGVLFLHGMTSSKSSYVNMANHLNLTRGGYL